MPFSQFPDDAYFRAFVVDRPLDEEQVRQATTLIEGFLASWDSHGRILPSGWTIAHGQVLLFAADTTQVPMKGCSGDALFGLLSQLEVALGVQIPATAPVVHHGPGGLVCTERPHFGELIRSGFVDGDTVVIDLTLASVGDLRARGFEMPARDCWHAKAWGALAT